MPTDLVWSDVGRGAPLLLIHGGLGLDHRYFFPALSPLADRLRLIAYDQRGCGTSPEPADWDRADFADWVEDVDHVRDAAGAERPVLLGHSFGGMIAIEYALRYPERVAGVIVSATAPALDFAERAIGRAVARATPAQAEALVAGLTQPFADDAAFSTFCATVVPLYFHRPTPGLEAALARVRFRAAGFNRTMHHWLPQLDLTPRLGGLRVPVLIASGTDDWLSPPDCAADRLEAGIPQVTRVDFTASGHFPFLEQPSLFQQALLNWMTAHGLLSAERAR